MTLLRTRTTDKLGMRTQGRKGSRLQYGDVVFSSVLAYDGLEGATFSKRNCVLEICILTSNNLRL